MRFYSPTLRLRRFTQVTPDLLRELGVTAIITDLDDTLAARNCYVPDEEVVDWITTMRNAGISVCIVSNNHKKRTENFASPLGIPFFYEAKKPLKTGVFNALKLLNRPKEQVVLLGDQLFTDMAVANRCKIKALLVDPVGTYGGWFVQLKRKLEIPLRKKIPYSHIK